MHDTVTYTIGNYTVRISRTNIRNNRGYVWINELGISFDYSVPSANVAKFTSVYDYEYYAFLHLKNITPGYLAQVLGIVINDYILYTHTEKYRDRKYYYSLVCGNCGDHMHDCYCKDCIECITSNSKCDICNTCWDCCVGYHYDDYEVNFYSDDNEAIQ